MVGLSLPKRTLLTAHREYKPKSDPPQYRCALCNKPRSRGFRATHPLRSSPDMPMGICSRPHCAKQKLDYSSSTSPSSSFSMDSPQVVVHHVHHYYHGPRSRPPPSGVQTPRQPGGDMDRPSGPSGPSCTMEFPTVAELPGDEPGPSQRNPHDSQPRTLIEPQVNYDRKPVFVGEPSRTVDRKAYIAL